MNRADTGFSHDGIPPIDLDRRTRESKNRNLEVVGRRKAEVYAATELVVTLQRRSQEAGMAVLQNMEAVQAVDASAIRRPEPVQNPVVVQHNEINTQQAMAEAQRHASSADEVFDQIVRDEIGPQADPGQARYIENLTHTGQTVVPAETYPTAYVESPVDSAIQTPQIRDNNPQDAAAARALLQQIHNPGEQPAPVQQTMPEADFATGDTLYYDDIASELGSESVGAGYEQ